MADDINLLPQQGEENKAELRQKRMVRQASVLVLVVVIGLVAVLGLVKLVLSTQINAAQRDIEAHAQRIEAKRNEEYTLRALSSKLTQLGSFLSTQNQYSLVLTELTKTMPSSVRATDLSIDEDNLVTFVGATSSYADLAGFYAKLRQAGATGSGQIGNYFQSPRLTAISRSEQSSDITFTMEFALGPIAQSQATAGGNQ